MNINKDLLNDLFWNQNKTYKELAEYFNCSSATIGNKLNKFGIKKKVNKSNLISQIFGKIEVIDFVGKTRSGNRIWKCKCSCGRILNRVGKGLIASKNPNCGICEQVGEISGRFWHSIINKAKIRNLEFLLTREYIWNLYIKQERKCALTGLELLMPKEGILESRTASLDRIDSNKPYLEGNVQWVHKRINIMKSNMTDKEFIEWCNIVSGFNKDKL